MQRTALLNCIHELNGLARTISEIAEVVTAKFHYKSSTQEPGHETVKLPLEEKELTYLQDRFNKEGKTINKIELLFAGELRWEE